MFTGDNNLLFEHNNKNTLFKAVNDELILRSRDRSKQKTCQ